jgi:hypothetical protein
MSSDEIRVKTDDLFPEIDVFKDLISDASNFKSTVKYCGNNIDVQFANNTASNLIYSSITSEIPINHTSIGFKNLQNMTGNSLSGNELHRNPYTGADSTSAPKSLDNNTDQSINHRYFNNHQTNNPNHILSEINHHQQQFNNINQKINNDAKFRIFNFPDHWKNPISQQMGNISQDTINHTSQKVASITFLPFNYNIPGEKTIVAAIL